jgi:ribonuclease HI
MTPLGFLMAEGATRPAEAIVRGQEARFRSRILTHAAPLPVSTHRRTTPTEDIIRCLTQHAASRCGFSTVENICQPSPSGHNPSDIIITLRAEAELMACNWCTLETECIWMDGSHMEDHTGAGFVREVNGALVSSEFYLGKHVEVFDMELFAIYRALHDFWANKFWRDDPPMAVTIFLDAQAALVHLRSDSPRLGQKLGRRINMEAAELWKWGIPVEYRWVPGHSNIPENEAANAAAKRATKNRCTAGALVQCENEVCLTPSWASLAHVSRLAMEAQASITKRWISQ